MSWFGLLIAVCVAFIAICGLLTTVTWYELIAQIQEHDRTFKPPLWGRPSWSEQLKVFQTHRVYFPGSGLRRIYWLLCSTILVSLLALITLGLFHPGPPSR